MATVLSIAGVADRATGFRGLVPMPVTEALAWFIEPGIIVWWFVLGSLFQPSPGTLFGYAVAIGANAALWLLAFLLARSILAWLRLAARARGRQ